MFHPDPEAHQIKQQLHLANSCYMMVSKKKRLAMDKFRNASPKADGSLKSFTTLAENTDAQHADPKSKRHGSSQFHMAGVPQQACVCAVIKGSFGLDRRDGSRRHQS